MKSKSLLIIVFALAHATLTCLMILAEIRSSRETGVIPEWLWSTSAILSLPVLFGMMKAGTIDAFGGPAFFLVAFLNSLVWGIVALGIVTVVAQAGRLTK